MYVRLMIFLALFGMLLAFFITTPVIVLFHELGHALAYLFLTKPENIDVYIGSYGLTEKSYNIRLGRLTLYLKKSFPFINRGLCKSSNIEYNYIKQLIIILAGPVFTVFIILVISIIIFNTDVHGSIKLYCFACIIFSIVSLFINLTPRTIKVTGKADIDNDGKQLRFVFRLKGLRRDYIQALTNIMENNISEAIDKLTHILKVCPREEKILRALINLLVVEKKHNEALIRTQELEQVDYLTQEEILQKACMQSFIGKHTEAEKNYRKVLKYDKNNATALNNLGYTLAESKEYIEANKLLNRLIRLYPDFIHGYCTLGYMQILEGKLEEGKLLVEKALETDIKDAYAYKALGIYYRKQGNTEMEKVCFDKAIEIDNTIDLNY